MKSSLQVKVFKIGPLKARKKSELNVPLTHHHPGLIRALCKVLVVDSHGNDAAGTILPVTIFPNLPFS